jgi:transposase
MLTLIWYNFFLFFKISVIAIVMADRLTVKGRRVVASLLEVFRSPTIARKKFAEQFRSDPVSRMTVYRVYKNFAETGSVANSYKGKAGRPRTGRSETNIAVIQQAILESPGKSTRRCSLEAGISHKTVWRILTTDLGMRSYHIQMVQALTERNKLLRVECCLLKWQTFIRT